MPALPIASITTSSASWFDLRFGAKPPSSPTPVARPRFLRMPRRAWKISAPTRSASLNELAPTGITMNSWKSTLVSAWAPPLRMLHIGTGSRSARAPPTIAWRSAPMCSKSGTRSSAAAARRAAIDTRERRVGAEPALVGGAVEGDHRLVERGLVQLLADDRLGDLAVDVGDRRPHALARVAGLVAVAELERLAGPGRGPRGHRRAPEGAAGELDIHFDRRVAPRIQNLPSDDTLDVHDCSSMVQ